MREEFTRCRNAKCHGNGNASERIVQGTDITYERNVMGMNITSGRRV